MILKDILYHRPESIAEAIGLSQECLNNGQRFHYLGGGTDLIPNLKRGQCDDSLHLISLGRIPDLKKIVEEDGKLKIGALRNLAELINHPLIEKIIPGLALAAGKIASPQIRSRATLGGNLLVDTRCVYFNQTETIVAADGACYKNGGTVCHLIPNASGKPNKPCRARFVSDSAAILVLADAQLEIASASGIRKIGLREFYGQDGISRNNLSPSEIVVGITVPLRDYRVMTYEKMRLRATFDFASVGIGFFSDGQTLHFSVNGVESYPLYRAFALPKTGENAVEGIYSSWLQGICEELAKNCSPLKQDLLSPAYRKQMIAVLAKRAAYKYIKPRSLNTLEC